MSRVVAGVDVGGTHVKLVLARSRDDGSSGTVLARRRLDGGADVTAGALAPLIVDGIAAMASEAAIATDAVEAVGLAVPGFVDPGRTASLFSPNTPGLVGDELPTRLVAAAHRPVVFDSDVNAATWGEAAWGAGRGAGRLLVLTLGTGVGGGLVVDGALVRLTGGTIGDIGHLILEPGGRRCTAGCSGCAEALVGTMGLVELARAAGAPSDTDRAAQVIAAAAAGQDWAVRAASQAGHLVGLLLASLMPVLLPDLVVLVGGTTLMGRPFLHATRRTLSALGGPPYVQGRRIVAGRFGPEAGAMGAAALAVGALIVHGGGGGGAGAGAQSLELRPQRGAQAGQRLVEADDARRPAGRDRARARRAGRPL